MEERWRGAMTMEARQRKQGDVRREGKAVASGEGKVVAVKAVVVEVRRAVERPGGGLE